MSYAVSFGVFSNCGPGSTETGQEFSEVPAGCTCTYGYACNAPTNEYGQCQGSCVMVARSSGAASQPWPSYAVAPGGPAPPPAPSAPSSDEPSDEPGSMDWQDTPSGGGGGYPSYPSYGPSGEGPQQASVAGSAMGAFVVAGVALAALLYFTR